MVGEEPAAIVELERLLALLPTDDSLIPRIETEITRLQRLLEERAGAAPSRNAAELIRQLKARGIDLKR